MEKVAVIDLGSNSARMVIYKILEGGHFVVSDELKETVRLGQDMERDGFLKPSRIAQAIKTLKMFRRLCDAENVDKIIAIGTNAIRRAKNQRSFIEEVYTTCGIKIKVLTVEEEATHIYQAVINSLEIPKGLIVDISGSSTQFIHYNRRNIINIENLPFGAITLTDLFSTGGTYDAARQSNMIYEFVADQLSRISWLKELEPDVQLVGVGGSFRNLGKIARRVTKYPLDMTHNYQLSRENFDLVYDMVKELDSDKLVKIKGLSSSRADIINSAFSVIRGVYELTGIKNATISGCGLREGIMFNYAVPQTAEKPLMDVVGFSIYTLMRYFEENEPHAEHVYNLSMQLFKQLRVLHKLPRQYVKVLRCASMLHDCGVRLSFYEHHKHSLYMIINSNLHGISHRDLILASFVASQHHREEFPLSEWQKYKSILLDEDLNAVLKLGVILRIAESLDRSMSGTVKQLNCDVLGDSVIMKTEAQGDCSLEIKDAMASASDFARAYKKNLEIL